MAFLDHSGYGYDEDELCTECGSELTPEAIETSIQEGIGYWLCEECLEDLLT